MNLQEFEAKTGVWIPAAGFGERMRPYTYLRAKACLPVGGNTPYVPMWQRIVNYFWFYIRPDMQVITCYYRPQDFDHALNYRENGKLNLNTMVTEVLHGTACDFDFLRLYFPSVMTWYLCMGDILPNGNFLRRMREPKNVIVVAKDGKSDTGILHERGGCQWFRENDQNFESTLKRRWMGILKVSMDSLWRPLPEPFLCTKSERHKLHGKSFQETYMQALIGGYQVFTPIEIEDWEVTSLGGKEQYERYLGKSEREILELLRT